MITKQLDTQRSAQDHPSNWTFKKSQDQKSSGLKQLDITRIRTRISSTWTYSPHKSTKQLDFP